MSTSTATESSTDREAALELRTAQSQGSSKLRWVLQPLMIAVLVVAVGVYVRTADLGTVEARALSLGSIWGLTVEHIQVSFTAAALVVVIAVPVGILMTRSWARRAAPPVVAFANVGQAVPSLGLLVLLALWWQTGFWTAVLALTIYGLLPSLRNTITGLQQVDQRLVEAGRGMGMSAVTVLLRVELPLAVPIILTGVRVSLVLIVGTAALATFIGAGGLGELVVSGVNLGRDNVLVVGAVLIAALALLIDWLGRVVEEIARPKGLS